MERIEYQLMNTLEQDFWWYRALHAAITERLLQLSLPAGAPVLDAGCGTGGLLKHVMTRASHLRFFGLEFDNDAAIMAEQKTGMAITRGSVNAMPFTDASFAAILSQDVLYHRNVDEHAMVSECYRCLQPGGHLLVHVAAFQWMASAHDEHVHGARRYNAQQLQTLLQHHGFRVVKTAYWNSLLFPLMALQRLTVGKHKASSDVHVSPAWQNRLFFRILDLERRLRLQLPYGGSVWAWGTKP